MSLSITVSMALFNYINTRIFYRRWKPCWTRTQLEAPTESTFLLIQFRLTVPIFLWVIHLVGTNYQSYMTRWSLNHSIVATLKCRYLSQGGQSTQDSNNYRCTGSSGTDETIADATPSPVLLTHQTSHQRWGREPVYQTTQETRLNKDITGTASMNISQGVKSQVVVVTCLTSSRSSDRRGNNLLLRASILC